MTRFFPFVLFFIAATTGFSQPGPPKPVELLELQLPAVDLMRERISSLDSAADAVETLLKALEESAPGNMADLAMEVRGFSQRLESEVSMAQTLIQVVDGDGDLTQKLDIIEALSREHHRLSMSIPKLLIREYEDSGPKTKERKEDEATVRSSVYAASENLESRANKIVGSVEEIYSELSTIQSKDPDDAGIGLNVFEIRAAAGAVQNKARDLSSRSAAIRDKSSHLLSDSQSQRAEALESRNLIVMSLNRWRENEDLDDASTLRLAACDPLPVKQLLNASFSSIKFQQNEALKAFEKSTASVSENGYNAIPALYHICCENDVESVRMRAIHALAKLASLAKKAYDVENPSGDEAKKASKALAGRTLVRLRIVFEAILSGINGNQPQNHSSDSNIQGVAKQALLNTF